MQCDRIYTRQCSVRCVRRFCYNSFSRIYQWFVCTLIYIIISITSYCYTRLYCSIIFKIHIEVHFDIKNNNYCIDSVIPTENIIAKYTSMLPMYFIYFTISISSIQWNIWILIRYLFGYYRFYKNTNYIPYSSVDLI